MLEEQQLTKASSLSGFVAIAVEVYLRHHPMESLKLADGLTRRQRDVLRLLAKGASNKQIAGALRISAKTVEFHRGRIMKLLGTPSIAGLTRFAISARLIEPHEPPMGGASTG